MNAIDTSAKSKSGRSPLSAASDRRNSIGIGTGIEEEPKLGRDGAASDDDISTSEDVELDDLSEDDLQDDEETGLTGKDKSRRKKRRRRNTLLDQRIAGKVKITAEEKKEADQYVVKNILINGLLIGLWYLFSLSISIVGRSKARSPYPTDACSTTNGCSIPNTSISTSHYFRPAHTCLYNLPSPP
jgi:solute carrier family 35 protein C2